MIEPRASRGQANVTDTHPRQATASRVDCLAPFGWLVLALALMLTPATPGWAQAAPVFSTTITPVNLDALTPVHGIFLIGEPVRVDVFLDGQRLPLGTEFPVSEPSLTLTLDYSAPLPAGIPSAASLTIYMCRSNECVAVPSVRSDTTGGGTLTANVRHAAVYAVGAPLLLTITPTDPVLSPKGQQQFEVTATDANGNLVDGLPITWSASIAAGTITPTGLFTVGDKTLVGTYPDAVTAHYGTSITTVTLRVFPHIRTYLSLAFMQWTPIITTNDTLFPLLWHLPRMNVPSAWVYSQGTGVTIAVIDSGVDAKHPDLRANTLPGADCTTYATDWNLTGSCTPSITPSDTSGHGSHVAGIAAAVADNSQGVAGVAPHAKILPMRALTGTSGTVSAIASAIWWATDVVGARVINLSVGMVGATPTSPPPQILVDAVNHALSQGAVVVAAGGNCSATVSTLFPFGYPVYPAALPGVIGVGATDKNDAIIPISCVGPWIDVVAPGGGSGGIMSTYPDNQYRFMSGTSMATPSVSGVAALLLSRYPTLSGVQVADIIRQSAVDLGPFGRDDTYGNGRVDAYRAMVASLDYAGGRAPAASATTEELEAALTWDASAETLAAQDSVPYAPGHVLVRADRAPAEAALHRAPQSLQAHGQAEVIPGWVLVRVPPGMEHAAAQALANQPGIQGVYLDSLVYAIPIIEETQ